MCKKGVENLTNKGRKIEGNKGYYLKNKNKIIKKFNSLVKVAKEIVSTNYDRDQVEDIAKQAYSEFEDLLSRLPYVGGDKSPFTSLMIQSALTAVFYKACKSLQLSPYEVGKLIYEIAECDAQSISSFKKFIKGDYLENWMGNFIEGDGETFDYGFNFIECGWLKLVEKEGIRDSAPYACLCDYARMRAIGIGFKRTETIAAGAEICDFRFVKKYETPRGWPPEDLEENKDFYAELKKKN
jgi:hypothetical protein